MSIATPTSGHRPPPAPTPPHPSTPRPAPAPDVAPGRPTSDRRRRPGYIDVQAVPIPLEGSLSIAAWDNPQLARQGHEVHSSYVELFWLGLLGPSSMMLLRRLAGGLERAPQGYRLPVVDTALSLGLGAPTSPQSHFIRALQRCLIFRVVRFENDRFEVRRHLPTLQPSQLARLPESLRATHAVVMTEHHRRRAQQRTPGVGPF